MPIVGKAAIYTRVSTDKQQDGASLDVQLEACRDYCDSRGLLVVEEFRDVLSGLNLERPAYREAVDLAKSKAVDKLVVWRLDRLGRDEAEYMTQLRDLRRLGVDVVSVTQPGESILLQHMLVVLAGEESRQLSIRISASKRRRSKEGKWGTSVPPFGYTAEKHPDGGSVLVPNEDAKLVRAMFKRYAKGDTTLRGIRNYLREHGHTTSVQSVLNRLRNPVYLGVIVHGKYARSRYGPKPDIAQSKGQHPSLVDQGTFDRVQAILSAHKKPPSGRPRKDGTIGSRRLFAGLVYCGECDHKYVAHPTGREGRYVTYYCNRKLGVGDCSNGSVPEQRLRAAVLEPLTRLISRLHKDDVRERVRKDLLLQQAAMDAAGDAERAKLEQRQTRLNERLTRLEDLYLDGNLDKSRYLERREGTQIELEAIKAQLTARPKVVRPDTDQLFAIADSLKGTPPDDEEWREIVAEMVERIVIEAGCIHVGWRDPYRSVLTLASRKII